MSWKKQMKVEKGAMDRAKALIKKLRDASFKRKIRKFLKTNLTVEYESRGFPNSRLAERFERTTPREQSLNEAKQILLQIVEEAWDETFPDKYFKVDLNAVEAGDV